MYGDPIPQDCRVCKAPGSEDTRRAWGCDTPTQVALFDLTCWECWGRSAACSLCGGRGRVPVHECPNRLVGLAELQVVRSAELLEAGITPHGGGSAGLPAALVDALAIVQRVKAQCERVKRERERARALSRQGHE